MTEHENKDICLRIWKLCIETILLIVAIVAGVFGYLKFNTIVDTYNYSTKITYLSQRTDAIDEFATAAAVILKTRVRDDEVKTVIPKIDDFHIVYLGKARLLFTEDEVTAAKAVYEKSSELRAHAYSESTDLSRRSIIHRELEEALENFQEVAREKSLGKWEEIVNPAVKKTAAP